MRRQTFSDIEIVLINNGSTDGADEDVRRLATHDSRIVLIDNTSDGRLPQSHNLGIQAARGDIIIRMDSDDLSTVNRIATQLAFFDENPDVGIVGSWVRTFGDAGQHLWKLPTQHEDICAQMLFCGALAHPALAYRKSRLTEFGLWYNEDFPVTEDFEFLSRASRVVRCANIPQVLLNYRTHANATTSARAQQVREYTDRVLIEQLRWLGMPLGADDVRLHYRLSQYEREDGEAFIDRSLDWMARIEQANRRTRRLDLFALRRQLNARRKWLIESVPRDQQGGLAARSGIFEPDRSIKVSAPVPAYSPDVFERLPADGCRALEKWKKQKIKVGMAILIHERPEYLENCLTSVFQTAASSDYELTVVLVDDGSLDDRVQQYMDLDYPGPVKCVRVYTQKTANNWGAAYNKAMKLVLALDDFDVVGSSDSDALFHPQWLQKLLDIGLWAKKNHSQHRVGPLSAFNSSDDEFHEWQGVHDSPHGQFVVKKRMGALNYMFCIEDFRRIGFFPEHRDDETEMTRKFQEQGWWNFSTMKSYVEHLGQNSVLNRWRPTAVSRAVFGLGLEEEGWPSNITGWQTLGYFRTVAPVKTFKQNVRSDLPIDVVYVAREADADSLELSAASVREYLRHPLSSIVVVGDPDSRLPAIAEGLGMRFVPEAEMLGIRRADISYTVKDVDRSGWIYQQLLKFGADSLASGSHYLVMDADTMLLGPQTFEHAGKDLVLHADEFHGPYFSVYTRLTGLPPATYVSSVSHQALINRGILFDLKTFLERKWRRPWFRAILDNIDYDNASGFSEYETYAQWAQTNFAGRAHREYFRNVTLPRTALRGRSLASLAEQYGGSYRSLSSHWYL